jgi:hypothetical protein
MSAPEMVFATPESYRLRPTRAPVSLPVTGPQPKTIPMESTVPKDYPDHHDAELVLKLYELRRESVMRDARKAMNLWLPGTVDDVMAILKPDHPDNAAFRQVTGYWEMAFGMARHGVIHAEFLAENSGEGIWFYSKVEPFVPDVRKISSPRLYLNAEWVATNTEFGQELMPRYRTRNETMLAAKKTPGKKA